MTDEEYGVLERMVSWHVAGIGRHGGAIDYGAIEDALRLLRRERDHRPVTVLLGPLVEDPGLCRRADWYAECHRRIDAELLRRPPS